MPRTPSQHAPSVRVRGITKRYGTVSACADVDLDLRPGEIHGVLGQNGAGKSTLMKILIGLVVPDRGEIEVFDERVTINDPLTAARLGIGMVHQHFSLVDALRVWENVILGDVGRMDPAEAKRVVHEIGARYGLDVDPNARIRDLSAGQRQRVEIVKCLRRNPRVLIFDEPTSVLTPAESRALFDVLRRVVEEEGRAVALVSHKLNEILHATDCVTIMRNGRVVDTHRTADTDASSLARAMVGRDVSLRSAAAALGAIGEIDALGDDRANLAAVRATSPDRPGPVLRIAGATVRGATGSVALDGLDLVVRSGEILGLAGVEGNGQTQLGEVLSSLLRLTSGAVEVDGVAVESGRAGAMARAGIGVIPEDRHDSGCLLGMSVAENLVFDDPREVATRGFLRRDRLLARARSLIQEFDIVVSSPTAPMWSLSGGNQQRVVLARELSRAPKVLVAAQPTRGLDVGAVEYMGERLRAAADSGVAVLLISTELEEILSLSDRIAVLYRGHIVGEMIRGTYDLDRLGMLLGGRAA